MSLYDRRATAAAWVRARGGLVDPAIYSAQYRAAAGASDQVTFKPDGKRGVFVCYGLARPALASTPPASKVSLSVEGKRISYNATDRRSLCHNDDTAFQGIHYSQWPAPIYVGKKDSLQLSETCYDTSGSLATLIYIVAGFHTTEDMAAALYAEFGELRAFGIDVAPVAATNGGNATQPFTIPKDDPKVWLEEFCAVDAVAAGGGDLDFIRVTLLSDQLYQAQRVSGSIGLALPKRMGIPASYIGRYATPGDNVTVVERVPSTSRRDVWNFNCVVGGRPDTVETGGMPA
jgi:hypothetical protein